MWLSDSEVQSAIAQFESWMEDLFQETGTYPEDRVDELNDRFSGLFPDPNQYEQVCIQLGYA